MNEIIEQFQKIKLNLADRETVNELMEYVLENDKLEELCYYVVAMYNGD